MMKDPEFVAEAKKSKLEVGALDGESVAKIVHETIDVPPALAKAVAKALQ